LICSIHQRLSSPETRDRCMTPRHAIPFVPLPGGFNRPERRPAGGKGDTLCTSLQPRPSDGPLASVCLHSPAAPFLSHPPLRMGSTFGHTGKFGVTRDVRFSFLYAAAAAAATIVPRPLCRHTRDEGRASGSDTFMATSSATNRTCTDVRGRKDIRRWPK